MSTFFGLYRFRCVFKLKSRFNPYATIRMTLTDKLSLCSAPSCPAPTIPWKRAGMISPTAASTIKVELDPAAVRLNRWMG